MCIRDSTSPSSTQQQRSHLATFISKDSSKDNADGISQSSAPLSRAHTRGAATDMGEVSATTVHSLSAPKSVPRPRSYTPREISSRSLSESFNVSKSDPPKPDLTLFYPKTSLQTLRQTAATSYHSQTGTEGGSYASNTGVPLDTVLARTWSGSSRRTPAHSRTLLGDQSGWASVVSAQTCPDSPITRSAPWTAHFPNISLHSAPHSTGSVSAPPKTSSSCTSPTDPSGGGSPAVDGVGLRGTPTGWRSRMILTRNASSVTGGDRFSQLSADSRTTSFEAAVTRGKTVVSPTSSGAPLHVVNTIMGMDPVHRTNPLAMMTPPFIHHADGSISDDLLEDPRQNQGNDRTHRSSDSLKMSSLQSGLYPSQTSEDHSSCNNQDIGSPTSRYNHLPSGGGLVHMEAIPNEVSLTIGTSSSSEGKRNHVAMQTSLTAMRRSHGSLKCGEGLSSFASSTNASHQQHQQLVASSSSYSTGTSKSIKDRNPRSTPSSNNTESGFPCSNHKGHFPFSSHRRRDSDLAKDAPSTPNMVVMSREMHTQTENTNNNNEAHIEVNSMNAQPQQQLDEKLDDEEENPRSQTSPFGELSRFSEPMRATQPLSAESPSLPTIEHTQGPDFQLASGPATGSHPGPCLLYTSPSPRDS
eukprot:TRINITY_DN21138_c0_g1_i3.p1 TRINITY_DN21138_c0_g1~~TRINITY_DN21138_c0_g1_i3.p1  ORF type:complete len:640 (-),score=34.06 TRINITY_DN21138_c0_g1_i3:154-2073(-)